VSVDIDNEEILFMLKSNHSVNINNSSQNTFVKKTSTDVLLENNDNQINIIDSSYLLKVHRS